MSIEPGSAEMGMIATALLITTPLAFLAGWISSKTLFRHLSVIQSSANAAVSANEVVRTSVNAGLDESQSATNSRSDSEATDPEAKDTELMRMKLRATQVEMQSLQADLRMLKEAAAEREQNITELKRKLQVEMVLPEETTATISATETIRQRKLLQAMKDRLDTAEQNAIEFKHAAEMADMKARRTADRFLRWREKMKPLARQFRQQRLILGELREELRQRDAAQRAREEQKAKPQVHNAATLDATAKKVLTASAATAESKLSSALSAPGSTPQEAATDTGSTASRAEPFAQDMASFGDEEREDLQSLKGIGPALHKKLNEQGVYRLKQLAVIEPQELKSLGRLLGASQKSIKRFDWPRQARQQLNMPEPQTAELSS